MTMYWVIEDVKKVFTSIYLQDKAAFRLASDLNQNTLIKNWKTDKHYQKISIDILGIL